MFLCDQHLQRDTKKQLKNIFQGCLEDMPSSQPPDNAGPSLSTATQADELSDPSLWVWIQNWESHVVNVSLVKASIQLLILIADSPQKMKQISNLSQHHWQSRTAFQFRGSLISPNLTGLKNMRDILCEVLMKNSHFMNFWIWMDWEKSM